MEQNKKIWQTPYLEVLDIQKTSAGPGFTIPDGPLYDPDEDLHHDPLQG